MGFELGHLVTRAQDVIGRVCGEGSGRVLIGITGPPAAGKSTLASVLADAIDSSVVVPMDGFHLSNVELERLRLSHRKGAPETFDAAGFLHLLLRIRRSSELVYAPAYSRVLHESIGGSVPVFPDTRVVLVEGNYLLLGEPPWSELKALLDHTFYVDAPYLDRRSALIDRQRERGLDEGSARGWVERSDEANAVVVERTRHLADTVLARRSE
jgi:pantothenate kinase